MTDEYTPDEEQVREQYTREQPPQIGTVSARRAEFNRMIAKVKAEAQVEALEDLATAHYLDGPHNVYDTIMRRADRIARVAGIETCSLRRKKQDDV